MAVAQLLVSAAGPFLYTVPPTVSCLPGNRVSGLSGAVSFLALDMKSVGSSGGGALVGAKDGVAVPVPGSDPLAGRLLGPACGSPPFAETTAMATAVPIATVASAPPAMNSSLRRLFRVSEASASAAQSGVPSSAPLFHGCWEFGFQGSH